MTKEERKERICQMYAKVFQSDEALHVRFTVFTSVLSILKMISKSEHYSSSWERPSSQTSPIFSIHITS